MTQINTKTILNYLPLDPKIKLDLLESFDSLPLEEQIRISRLAWEALANFENIKLKENFDKNLSKAVKENNKFDNNYYQTVSDDTQKEIETDLAATQSDVDLSKARKSMEQIIKEINAVKKQAAP
jgi:hypothetical protein